MNPATSEQIAQLANRQLAIKQKNKKNASARRSKQNATRSAVEA